MTQKTTKGKWHSQTLAYLKNRPRDLTLADIEKDTGLPEAWLKLLSRDAVDNPSVNRVEILYNYFVSRTAQSGAGE